MICVCVYTAADQESDEMDEETEALLQADYEIGHFIRERVVPRAVLYFTGEACDVSTPCSNVYSNKYLPPI